MWERSGVPSCDECEDLEEFGENDLEWLRAEVCPECPWFGNIENPLLDRLLHYLELVDAGCPVGRHELTDVEWKLLGAVKGERERLTVEKAKEGRD